MSLSIWCPCATGGMHECTSPHTHTDQIPDAPLLVICSLQCMQSLQLDVHKSKIHTLQPVIVFSRNQSLEHQKHWVTARVNLQVKAEPLGEGQEAAVKSEPHDQDTRDGSSSESSSDEDEDDEVCHRRAFHTAHCILDSCTNLQQAAHPVCTAFSSQARMALCCKEIGLWHRLALSCSSVKQILNTWLSR